MGRGGDQDKRRSDQGENGKSKYLWYKSKKEGEENFEPNDRPDASAHSITEGVKPKLKLRLFTRTTSQREKMTREPSENFQAPFLDDMDDAAAQQAELGKASGGLFGVSLFSKAGGRKSRQNSIDLDSGVTDNSGHTPQHLTAAFNRNLTGLKSASSMPIGQTLPGAGEGQASQQPKKVHRRTTSVGDGLPPVKPAATKSAFERILSKWNTGEPSEKAGENVDVAQTPRIGTEYNAGLINLGNQCFFNALLQVIFHTRVLPRILWRSYPDVPDLPAYLWDEELMSVAIVDKPLNAPKTPERQISTPISPSPPSDKSFAQLRESSATRASSAASSVNDLTVQSEMERSSPRSTSGNSVSSGAASDPQLTVRTQPELMNTSPPGQDQPPSPRGESPTSEASLPPIPESTTLDKGLGDTHHLADGRSAAAGSLAGSSPKNLPETAPPSPSGTGAPPSLAPTSSAEGGGTPEPQMSKIGRMCERARSRQFVEGALCHALAWTLLQMQISERPVNPFPALHFFSQKSDLVDGLQQDTHEAFLVVRQYISESKFKERGPSIDGLYSGTKVVNRSCKQCNYSSRKADSFADVSLVLHPPGVTTTVQAALQHHCNPPKPSTECQQCKTKRLENAEKPTMLQSLVNVFQTNPNNKEHDDCMKESVTFDELPNCLVFHMVRAVFNSEVNTTSKDETAVAVNLNLRMWDHLSEKKKEEYKDEQKLWDYRLFAVVCHQGGQAERGHFIAMCRTDEGDDSWRKFDDEKPPEPLKFKKPIKSEKVDMTKRFLELDAREQKEVCMCFYERCSQPVTLRDSRVEAKIQALRDLKKEEQA